MFHINPHCMLVKSWHHEVADVARLQVSLVQPPEVLRHRLRNKSSYHLMLCDESVNNVHSASLTRRAGIVPTFVLLSSKNRQKITLRN